MWLKRKGEGEKEMSFRNWFGFAMVTLQVRKGSRVTVRSILPIFVFQISNKSKFLKKWQKKLLAQKEVH